MKKIILTLYSFDELPEEAKNKIIERERWNIMNIIMTCWSSEYCLALAAFEKLFSITCNSWHADYCSYGYSFSFDNPNAFEWADGCILFNDLSGKLLQRYLRRNIIPYIEKGKYYSCSFLNSKYMVRYSKIIKQIDCPLTGCIYDHFLLAPLIDYISHSDEKLNFYGLVNNCLNNFFRSWHKEYHYWADNREALIEELHCNQYENTLYYINGYPYEGLLEDVA